MNDKSVKKGICGREELLAAALLCLGFALRLVLLGSLPRGLNQDEASAAYDAFAILKSGADRCGNPLPALLESWGSGQNALMSYLSVPFIALFGLNGATARIVCALAGCAGLTVFWRFARAVRGRRFGLCALLFLSLCPWHIMASRWGLESNLLPTLLLTGIFFTALARDRPRRLIPAAVCFGLSLYAYGTAYFFLPPFLVFAVLWLGKRLRPVSFLVSLGIFVLIALPVSLCQLRNVLGLPAGSFLGLSLPALTQSRQLATSVFGGGGLDAALANFKSFLSILLRQSDGLTFNSLGLWKGGLFYFFGLPLALMGVLRSVTTRRGAPLEAPMLAALCCGFLSAFFIDGNINRLNMVWLPLIYFASLGLYYMLCQLGRWGAIPLAALAACAVIFCHSYVNTFGYEGNSSYFPGLGECVEYVDGEKKDSAFISYYVNQPYIFALFYTQADPVSFERTVEYINPDGAFRWVSSYGYWRFGPAEEAGGDMLILHSSEAGERQILFESGQFVVCAG